MDVGRLEEQLARVDSDLRREIISLVAENERLASALEQSEAKLRYMTASAPVGLFLDDANGQAIYINAKCAELVGAPADDLLNFDWIPFLHPDDRDRMVTEWQTAYERSEVFRSEYRWVHPDGKVIWTLGEVVPVFGPDGKATMFVGTLTDITDRKRAEQALESTLGEKEVLLREVYHRTRNAMQIVRSFLILEESILPDSDEVRRLVDETQSRISAMALVHEKLYVSRDLSRIPARDYVEGLSDLILRDHLDVSERVRCDVQTSDLTLLIDVAIPFGLVLNELLTNSAKYAFPGNRTGHIAVSLNRGEDGAMELRYADDGVGLPPGFDPRTHHTLGFQIIHLLAEEQLGGSVSVSGDEGLRCTVRFPDPRANTRV